MNNKPHWLIGFYRYKKWESFSLPEELKEETVERLLLDLNANFCISILKNIKGVWEPKATVYTKGTFIGLL